MTGLVKGIIFTAAMGGSEAPLPEVAPPYLLSPPTVEAVCSSTPHFESGVEVSMSSIGWGLQRGRRELWGCNHGHQSSNSLLRAGKRHEVPPCLRVLP